MMDFMVATPTKNYPTHRVVSTNSIWEMGYHPTLFGCRIAANRIGSDAYVIDYCAGDNRIFLAQLFVTVFIILSCLPEGITEQEFEAIMPKWNARPINLDDCWEKLQALSEVLVAAELAKDAAFKVSIVS